MTTDEARALVADVLGGIAPDVEVDDLDPREGLRRQADLDSLDFLAFVETLVNRSGVELTETDYPALDSLDGAARLLADRSPAAQR